VVILIILSFLEELEFDFLVWECGIDCSIGHTWIFVCETYYSEIPLSGISLLHFSKKYISIIGLILLIFLFFYMVMLCMSG
jgi:hypothetical protein